MAARVHKPRWGIVPAQLVGEPDVVMRMVAGAPFEATAEKTIHVAKYGGGILIS